MKKQVIKFEIKSEIKFEIENNEAIITSCYHTNKKVTIPSNIDGVKVTKIGRYAFKGCDAVDIVLPNTIKHIEPYAFWDCSSLKKINIPSGIDTIEDYTFMECSSL